MNTSNYFKILQKHFSYQISKYGQQYKNMLKPKVMGHSWKGFPKSMMFLFFNSLEFPAWIFMGICMFSITSELEYWFAQKVIEQHLSMLSISAVSRFKKRQWNV